MDIEIELKFLVSPTAGPALAQLVSNLTDKHDGISVEENTVHLANTYYDTDEQLLRQHDIGLRTRSTDGVWEQTIKTKGTVVGGLHQRQEYNIAINANQPDLDLFDPAILPKEMTVRALQSALGPLFTTDFTRQIWRVKKPDCEFEMVFDLGSIVSQDKTLPICEVELELVKGDAAELFEFARKMLDHLSKFASIKVHEQQPAENNTAIMRIGAQSKAARGYQLLSGEALKERSYLSHVPLKTGDELETAFTKTIEYGLAFMQYHEQCFIDNPSLLALRRFTDGAALIRHGLWLFSMIVSPDEARHFRGQIKWILQSFDWVEHSRQLKALMSKTGKYRKKLDLNTALSQLVDEEVNKAPSLSGISQFFSLTRYNHFILDISQWLLDKGWRNTPSLNLQDATQAPIHNIADDLLSSNWQSLLALMPRRDNLSIDDYISHHQQLKRCLMTGSSLGGLYAQALREDFRLPWMDLSRGIDELKTLHLLQSLAMRIDAPESRATLSWLEQQIESLLLAMEQSRTSAVKMRPYWVN